MDERGVETTGLKAQRKEVMSQTAVQEILHRIEQLTEEERLLLEERLTELAEAEWKREAEEARRIAKNRGLDQATIDEAIRDRRYPS